MDGSNAWAHVYILVCRTDEGPNQLSHFQVENTCSFLVQNAIPFLVQNAIPFLVQNVPHSGSKTVPIFAPKTVPILAPHGTNSGPQTVHFSSDLRCQHQI